MTSRNPSAPTYHRQGHRNQHQRAEGGSGVARCFQRPTRRTVAEVSYKPEAINSPRGSVREQTVGRLRLCAADWGWESRCSKEGSPGLLYCPSEPARHLFDIANLRESITIAANAFTAQCVGDT
jgi:hypothetical protein